MQHTPPISSEIVRQGRSAVVDLPTVAAMLRDGLTPTDYEVLALVADQHRMSVADLMRLALEVQP